MEKITKFVILVKGRCGSNMLLHMLRQHPQVDLSAYEAFSDQEGARGNRLSLQESDDGGAYAREAIYGVYPEGITTVGFKLGYRHAQSGPNALVWDYISGNDVKVIHLNRSNILDWTLSDEMAYRQNKWISTDRCDGTYERIPIEITFEKLVSYSDEINTEAKKIRRHFSGNDIIELDYNDLASNPKEVARDILGFLDLDLVAIEALTKKQRVFSQKELISNYDELKEEITKKRPECLWFFDES